MSNIDLPPTAVPLVSQSVQLLAGIAAAAAPGTPAAGALNTAATLLPHVGDLAAAFSLLCGSISHLVHHAHAEIKDHHQPGQSISPVIASAPALPAAHADTPLTIH
jgi:hypothetical protein